MLKDSRVNVERYSKNIDTSVKHSKYHHISETSNRYHQKPNAAYNSQNGMHSNADSYGSHGQGTSQPADGREFHITMKHPSPKNESDNMSTASSSSKLDEADDDSQFDCSEKLLMSLRKKPQPDHGAHSEQCLNKATRSLGECTVSEQSVSSNLTADTKDIHSEALITGNDVDNIKCSVIPSASSRIHTYGEFNDRDDTKDDSSIQTNSDLYKSVDNDSLKVLLGQDRFERMLKNFEDFDNDDTIVSEEYPELKTHRPDVSTLHFNYTSINNFVGYPHDEFDLNAAERRMPQSVKCAFAAEEVYREASAFSDVLSSCTTEVGGHDMREEFDGSITDVSSSLIGREITTLRQRPYGPIPQRTERQKADPIQSKYYDHQQTTLDLGRSLADEEQIRFVFSICHDHSHLNVYT